MRIVVSLFLVMLAAMAMTCDEHGKSPPDGHSAICGDCPFVACCAKLGRCIQCNPGDAGADGVPGDAPRDVASD